MALGGEWIMSIKPIVDSIQFVLEIVIIAIFIVRIYVKKKKRISVKKYNRVINYMCYMLACVGNIDADCFIFHPGSGNGISG